MELHALDVARFERRRVAQTVGADRRRLFYHRDVIAVREIDLRPRRDAAQKIGIGPQLQLIPAHVRHARPFAG